MYQPKTHGRLRRTCLMCAESYCTPDVFTSGNPSQKPWILASRFTHALAVLMEAVCLDSSRYCLALQLTFSPSWMTV